MSWGANRALFPFYFLGETKNKWLSCSASFWEVGVGNSKGGEIGRENRYLIGLAISLKWLDWGWGLAGLVKEECWTIYAD